ncbi:MAG: protein kinase [Gemmataceae bacterium]|nr:protein kinase [Gemmataceae bacterium]
MSLGLEKPSSLDAETVDAVSTATRRCPEGHPLSDADTLCPTCGTLPPGAISAPAQPGLPSIPGYDIHAELGRGGMGVVYRARHQQLGRTVAIKMIRSGAFASSHELERFESEARAVARLQHPNIVQIFEVGVHRERPGATPFPFMALEYLEGKNLSQEIHSAPLSPRRAATLAVCIADALQHAHEKGIVHRDLKPANILLNKDGLPKITDFGLAKHLDLDSDNTATGEVMGTPEFMAPEQAIGAAKLVGPAADVFSLGSTIYAMLAGKSPFRGPSALETVERVRVAEPAPLRSLRSDIPRDLETIVAKCLQKAPARRYLAAQDAADDLRRFLKGDPILARPINRIERVARWCRRYPTAAALLLVLALATAGALWGWTEVSAQRDEKIAESKKADDAKKLAQENEKKENEQRLKAEAATEDAKKQAEFAAASAAKEREAKEALDRELYRARILLADQYWFANNVPDAEQSLAECPPALRGWEWHYLMRLCRGSGRAFAGIATASSVDFADKGTKVVAVGPGQPLTTWNRADGVRLSSIPDIAAPGDYRATAALDPVRGRAIVPVKGQAKFVDNRWEVASVVDIATGKVLFPLTANSPTPMKFSFAPDGTRILGHGLGAGIQFWEGDAGKPLANVPLSGVFFKHVEWSPDCTHVAIVGSKGNRGILILRNVANEKEVWSVEGDTFDQWNAPGFDGKGKLVALGGKRPIKFDPKAKPGELKIPGFVKVWDVASGMEKHGFETESEADTTRLSPDGRYIGTYLPDVGVIRIFDIERSKSFVAGSGLLRGNIGWPRLFAFSADSKRLAFGGGINVQVLDLDARKAIHEFRGHAASVVSLAFSEDGKHLASGGDGVRLWSMDADAERRVLAEPKHDFERVSFLSNASQLAIAKSVAQGSLKSEAMVWNRKEEIAPRLLGVLPNRVISWVVSKNGRELTLSGLGPVQVLETATGKELMKIEADPSPTFFPTCAAVSPDGSIIAVGSAVRGGVFRKRDSGEEVFRWPEKPDPKAAFKNYQRVHCIAFKPDGKQFAIAAGDEVRVFDAQSYRSVATIPQTAHAYGVSLAFRAGTSQLVVNGAAGLSQTPQIRIFDVTTGKPVGELKGHLGTVECIAITPDGKRLATASSDATIRIWNLDTHQPMLALRGLHGYGRWVDFSGDGNCLAGIFQAVDPAAGVKSEVRIWDARPQ